MNGTILIFEDESITALHLRTLLASLGYSVAHVANSTRGSTDLIQAHSPDLVLMDIRIKGEIDAIETAESIHEKFGTPVVFLSAHNDEATRLRIESSRAYGLVAKPFDEQEVYVAIRSTLHRRELEKALAPAKDVAPPLLTEMGDAVVATDADGLILYMNESAEKLTGWRENEAFEHEATDVIHLNEARDGSLVNHPVSSILRAVNRVESGGESFLTSRSGSQLPTSHRVRSVLDPEGKILGAVVSIRRRRDLQLDSQSASDEVPIDAETGLVSSDLLMDFLEETIARARNRHTMVAVFVVKICERNQDGESSESTARDALLCAATSGLQECVRVSDAVVRTRNNTIVIIQPDLEHADGAIVLGDKLVQFLSRPFVIEDIEITVVANVGVALFPVDGTSPAHLLDQAMKASDSEPDENSSPLRFFSEEVDSAISEEQILEEDLDAAIANGQFEIRYQPTFDLSAKRIVSALVDLSWRHPSRGTLPAAAFFPVAERHGVSASITDWVTREALRRIATWSSIAPGIRVTIPLAGSEIRRRSLVPHIVKILGDTGIDGFSLEFELREDQLVSQPAMTTHLNLQRLRQIGVYLAIGNFGFEFASMMTLKKTPVHRIKIDSSLVATLAYENEAQAIVKTTIDLARNWGLEVAASGIDDESQWRWLRYHGCEIGQGKYLGGPLSGPEFFEKLIEQRG